MTPMGDELYIHRAVIVPKARGGDVYNSIEEAPEKIRRLIERGSTFTIVIADRSALKRRQTQEAAKGQVEQPTVPAALVREVFACLAVAALIGWLALSR